MRFYLSWFHALLIDDAPNVFAGPADVLLGQEANLGLPSRSSFVYSENQWIVRPHFVMLRLPFIRLTVAFHILQGLQGRVSFADVQQQPAEGGFEQFGWGFVQEIVKGNNCSRYCGLHNGFVPQHFVLQLFRAYLVHWRGEARVVVVLLTLTLLLLCLESRALFLQCFPMYVPFWNRHKLLIERV